jgi:hypothetical protein
MAMSDWGDTGPKQPGKELTVTSLGVTFEVPDSEATDTEAPDLLTIVGQVLPGATFADPA